MRDLFTCYMFYDGDCCVQYDDAKLLTFADKDIRKLLKMNLQEYKQLFNKYNLERKGSPFFVNQEYCQKLCDYLNEVYAPMIKLTE